MGKTSKRELNACKYNKYAGNKSEGIVIALHQSIHCQLCSVMQLSVIE